MVRADTEGATENGLGAAYRSKYAKATTGAPVTVIDYRGIISPPQLIRLIS